MNNIDWKVGDWVIFDLAIGQIKELRPGGASFTDGFFETSGSLVAERFRPLTLRNKRIVETLDVYYSKRLRDIDGEAGFNYPDISAYFSNLALVAIDGDDTLCSRCYDKADQFIRGARAYQPIIDGVHLFRRKLVRRRAEGDESPPGQHQPDTNNIHEAAP